MSHTPHELAEDFPDKLELIHQLKMTDGEFQHLADEYHRVNRAVHRAETNVEPCDQFAEEHLRKKRLHLKDRIAAKLNAVSSES